MHFVFSPFGSAGDVHPYLGLALALKARGHDITFVVNGYFKDLVERVSIPYEELGTREEFLEATNNPDLWDPKRAFKHIFRSLVEVAMRGQYDVMARHYEPGRSVGVINCLGFGALVAQDKLGMPMVTINLQPSVIWSRIRPPVMPMMFGPRWMRNLQFALAAKLVINPAVGPGLNGFRAELGLPPVKNLIQWWQSKSCVACLFPDWFCPPQADWPTNLIQTDFPLWDSEAITHLPAHVEAFLAAGDAPLVFTPGSANTFGAKFFAAAAETCRLMGRRGILLTRFPEQIPQQLPAGVVHFDYVPFSLLLPRAAAVVHHAGVGSLAQGFAAGVPQLLTPLAHDQFDNSARAKELGVADWLKDSQLTAPRMASLLDKLLASPFVKNTCQKYARRLEARDGCQRMAAALERWYDPNQASASAAQRERLGA